MTSNLDDRVVPSIDYIRHDQIICDLMDIIKCPITIDISEDPVLFNNQFYDRIVFDTFRAGEYERNTQAIVNGYNDHSVFLHAQ